MGARALIVHMPDPLLVVVVGLALAEYGLGALVLIGLVNGLVAIGAGYVIPRLRIVFPPAVAGIVICVAGLSLIEPALRYTFDMNDGSTISPVDTLVGTTTLIIKIGRASVRERVWQYV